MPEPGAGACPHDLPHSVERLGGQRWKQEFLRYYGEERKVPEKATEAALTSFDLEDEKLNSRLKEAEEQLASSGEDGKGGLGEAHLSFLLEEDRDIVLTWAAWKASPFVGKKGIDLVGVYLEDLSAVYAEGKVGLSTEDFVQEKTLEELSEQLKLERIRPEVKRKVGIAAPLQITAAVKRLIREDRLDLPEEVTFEVTTDSFARIGSVIADDKESWNPILGACPCDYTDNLPCELILLIVDELEKRLNELTAFEIVAKEHEGEG